jgi:hypothetical protein
VLKKRNFGIWEIRYYICNFFAAVKSVRKSMTPASSHSVSDETPSSKRAYSMVRNNTTVGS